MAAPDPCVPLPTRHINHFVVMAFDAATRQGIERDFAAYVEPIRPLALCREEFDIGYRIHEHSVEIFAIHPGTLKHYPVAKTT